MKKILIIILTLAVINIVNATNETEIRNVDDYDKITVCCGIKVKIAEGNNKSEVKLESNIDPKYIITEVKNKTLQIAYKENIPKKIAGNITLTVYIFNAELSEITASKGSEISTYDATIKTNSVINAANGSTVNLNLDNNSTVVNSNSGSIVILNGDAETGRLITNSGSRIEAFGLKIKNGTAIASSGSKIEITAIETLIANSSYGSRIEYKGDPETKSLTEIDRSSSVTKK